MHPMTAASLRQALFTRSDFVLPAPTTYTDEDQDWASPDGLRDEPRLQPATPWSWHGPAETVEGPAWGGCLEIVDLQLRAGRYLLDTASYRGAVLFLETSEEQPDATYVYRALIGMGERGLLGQFSAVVMGRAKAWSFDRPNTADAKMEYARQQRDAVLRAIDEYNPRAVVVFDVDLGHTDPQVVMPHGGHVVVDARQRQISVQY
jgi:muramoyltetrapeptide carboxypeptidase LdcA involved in peptidoglycan recycling